MTETSFRGPGRGRGFRPRKLYRDQHLGLIRGVCAGIANSLGIDSLVVRLVAVIAFLVFPIATAVAYLIAGFALRETPEYSY